MNPKTRFHPPFVGKDGCIVKETKF
ncbi:uncharacterized protein METZ01_LOCUS413002 [marine metagenome]|uniref:Uncharacterized protein n=1 Tax=marine metagenome TaxID=408172 RepID=A0A382WPT9_9ZZZZ